MKKGKNIRDGIILAAGLGSRLNNSDLKTTIKPLANVESITLLVRTINSLEVAGCRRAVIVLGWKAEQVKKQITTRYKGPLELVFVYNKNYRLKNGISVLCARPFITREYILTMADHILDDDIMYRIRDHHPPEGGATLCVDYKLDTIFDMDDATKVQTLESRIIKIGKELSEFNCIDTGVFIGTEGLMGAIEEVYNKKGDSSLSDGVQLLAQRGLMEALDIKNSFWQDVDNMDMLLHAEKLLRWSSKKLKKAALN